MTTEKPLILLVEDDQADVEWDLDVLRGLGLARNVLVLRDGAEAMRYLFPPARPAADGDAEDDAAAEPAVLPRLILLDLHLPKVDGLEILRRVKSDPELRAVPLVVLTGSLPLAVEVHDVAADTSYVVKPIVPHELARVLGRLNLSHLVSSPGDGGATGRARA
jgi:CheY-like chemotaxis protein